MNPHAYTTSGSIVRQLTTLALPLFVGNLFQQLYNMIDAVILGWCNGADAFGAVGIGGTVMNLFLFILAGACTGISVLLSQLFGKGAFQAFRREFFQALLFGGLFTLCISGLFLLFLDPLLRLIQTPQTLLPLVRRYLQIILGGLLVQGVVNSLGTASINAYTAATRIEGFANSFGDSGSAAESIFLGQNSGAGNRERVKQGRRNAYRMMVILGIVMATLLFTGAPVLSQWMLPKGESEACMAAVSYLRTVAIFYPLCFIGCANVGFFQGTGKIHIPAICSALHLTLRVLLSWKFADSLGLTAVAAATGLGWCLAVTIQQKLKPAAPHYQYWHR